MSILRTENLYKIYDTNGIYVIALKDVTLEIDKGDFLVLAGPSGSGKTTLLNLLGSLDKPSKGKVFLDNEDLANKSKKELSLIRLNKMGFIFQAYNLIPVLTAIENIEFPMMLLGVEEKERKQKALDIMAYLGIDNLTNKRPNQMSGGQQQRVAVARAIINDPLVVLADEPTANLDSKTGSNLLDLMNRMNEDKNITFIFASHDSQVINRAKRLVRIEDGSIIEDKTV
jgi:putative ABC transport system ATP-binding protein